MPDALSLLKTRKSVSAAFLGEPGPTEAELAEMLAVASRVPDHGKLAPWRFIVFEGEARRQAGELIGAIYRARHPDAPTAQVDEERGKLARAPLVVAVVSTAAPHVKIPEWEQVLSAGNAAFALVMAAHALGYAANWTTGFAAYDADARRAIGLADAERLVAFVNVGTPKTPPTERPRPDLDRIVTRWAPGSAA